ncbi:MAG: beta-galactosidase [Candidatus Sumerlaeota bacterium]|nr:beta-galactosidase [Candidatus Sumerlaeota bacterium]
MNDTARFRRRPRGLGVAAAIAFIAWLSGAPALARGAETPSKTAAQAPLNPAAQAPLESAARNPAEWRVDPLGWEWREGAWLASSANPSVAVWRDNPLCMKIALEATVTPRSATGETWKTFGIVLCARERDYWQLALTEAPASAKAGHSSELSEMRDGVWLSQKTLKSLADEGPGAWSLNQPYRMRLELAPGKIEGWSRDASGALVRHRAFQLNGYAVAMGRPALRVWGGEGTFTDIRATFDEPVGENAAASRPAFPPFAAAGPSPGLQGKRTGFFHPEEIDGRWWVVDPNGAATLALGTDHVTYQGSFCETLGYNPYGRKNDEKYKSQGEWEDQTLARLRSWDFDLLGAGCQASLFRRAIAHCQGMRIGNMFTDLGGDCEICPNEKHPGSAFPNVFHPKFREWCEYQVEDLCRAEADDPWLFGYFLDNELAWWGRRQGIDYGLFDAVMAKGAGHSAKRALCDFLKGQYPSIREFNAAWKTDLKGFDDVLALDQLGADDNERTVADKRAFVARIADTYFRVITESIRKFDPNHSILGCRFAGGRASDAVWAACGKYCDIGSFNYYGSVDLDRQEARGGGRDQMERPLPEVFQELHQKCGRPLMITEWSFPALDAGLPSTRGAGQRFRTQAERAEASRIYLTTILRLPFMVGSDYFMWSDEPPQGVRSTFPENSNYGLVNVDDKPYPLLTEALRHGPGRTIWPSEGRGAAPLAGPLRFEGSPKGFIAGNSQLTLEWREGGDNLISSIQSDGVEIGRYNAMICQTNIDTRAWPEVNRQTETRAEAGEDWLAIDLTGRYESAQSQPHWAQPYEVCQRLILLPDRPWFVAQLRWVRNLGTEPLHAAAWYFRCHSRIRGEESNDTLSGGEGAVPRLWKARQASAWLDPDGGYFGAIAPAGSGGQVRFWLDPKGGRHPDASVPADVTIAPGETFRPEKPVWMVIAAGAGSPDDWNRITVETAELAVEQIPALGAETP